MTSESFEKYFEDYIDLNIKEQQPSNLYRPFYYGLENAGKLMRPKLLVNTIKLFGGTERKGYEAALAFELFHNFTLFHDDIMDNAELRRGRESVYKKFGNTAAILSGDAMLLHAYKLLLSYSGSESQKLLKLFTDTGIEICNGQQMDMDFETRELISEAEYFEMIQLKTAVLLASSMKAGAIISNTNSENEQLIYDFGIHLGIAFQLVDDYLDTFGNPEQTGKKAGGDILNNKKTLLYIKTLELLNEDKKDVLTNTYASEAKKIEAIGVAFVESGAKGYCLNAIEQHRTDALKILDVLTSISPEGKDVFLALAEKAIVRER
jgi:geranylgeranyl diphosphate synthase type II